MFFEYTALYAAMHYNEIIKIENIAEDEAVLMKNIAEMKAELMKVVGILRLEEQKNRPEAQTKDRRLAIVWPYVSIMRRWAICLYWLAVGVGLGHMFLLCGARLYVSIGWL